MVQLHQVYTTPNVVPDHTIHTMFTEISEFNFLVVVVIHYRQICVLEYLLIYELYQCLSFIVQCLLSSG